MTAITPKMPVYSSEVILELRVGEQRFPLRQVGPEFIIFAQTVSLPATLGEVVVTLDGEDRIWPVRLPNGSQPAGELTATADV